MKKQQNKKKKDSRQEIIDRLKDQLKKKKAVPKIPNTPQKPWVEPFHLFNSPPCRCPHCPCPSCCPGGKDIWHPNVLWCGIKAL